MPILHSTTQEEICHVKTAYNQAVILPDSLIERIYYWASRVCEVLQSEKTQLKYWMQGTWTPLNNAKIQTKTNKMDLLEAFEDETLESHSRG